MDVIWMLVISMVILSQANGQQTKGRICEERCQRQCSPDCDFTCCIPPHPSGKFSQETETSSANTHPPLSLATEQCAPPCPSSCSPACAQACCEESLRQNHNELLPIDGQRKSMPFYD